MPVLADSSVLIALVKIGKLDLLRGLYERVMIPPAVNEEVVEEGRRLGKRGIEALEDAVAIGWIQVERLTNHQYERAQTERAIHGIGKGEAEALALAKARGIAVILDDKRARDLARPRRVQFLGTAAVLLQARFKGLLSDEGLLESLRELGKVMWLSPEVMAELLRKAGEAKGQ